MYILTLKIKVQYRVFKFTFGEKLEKVLGKLHCTCARCAKVSGILYKDRVLLLLRVPLFTK